MNIYKCPECGKALTGFIPAKCVCGFSIPVINGVWQFTNDNPISIDGDGLKWLGYEHVGENYRPDYFYNKDNEKLGNYTNLAEFLGDGKIVLDIGSGVGEFSISVAMSGLRVVSVDISQTMLEAAVKRAQKHNPPDENIIFARMNGYKLEIADSSIDAVRAQDVLHQVDKPELMMAEILRVLKPEGYLLQPGGGKNLGFTEKQAAANSRYNDAEMDIHDFYHKLVSEAGYGEPVFSSWEKAAECINAIFIEFKPIDDTGAYWADNVEWPLKWGLHKTKTRAAGSTQLIPDDVHNSAWAKTEEYAKSKYGENYEDMTRFHNHTSGVVLYKRRA